MACPARDFFTEAVDAGVERMLTVAKDAADMGGAAAALNCNAKGEVSYA